jgi:hypothetical protein
MLYGVYKKKKKKINLDAALDSMAGRIGIDIIVRDSKGKVYAAISRSLCALPKPVVSEAIATLRATEFSRNKSFHKITLEGNSLQNGECFKCSRS